MSGFLTEMPIMKCRIYFIPRFTGNRFFLPHLGFCPDRAPGFLIENRLKEYEQMDRGFFVPYDTWPYLKCKDIAALPDMAVKYRDEDFTTLYKQHF